jgi:hypothetical protein
MRLQTDDNATWTPNSKRYHFQLLVANTVRLRLDAFPKIPRESWVAKEDKIRAAVVDSVSRLQSEKGEQT